MRPSGSGKVYATAKSVCSTGTSYLKYFDADQLMQLASKHDLVLKVSRVPGDFKGGERLTSSRLHSV